MKTFLVVSVEDEQVRSTLEAKSLEKAMAEVAENMFGWSGEEPLEEFLASCSTRVVPYEGEWYARMHPKMIVGVDEVGLGAWAGPLVVCAFAAPDEEWTVEGLNDSKKLSPKMRGIVDARIREALPGHWAVLYVDAETIDRHGVGVALKTAMSTAVDSIISLLGVPNRVIIDGEDNGIPGAEFYAKADSKFPSVMAASVIAKVARDGLMTRYAQEYPGFGFENHVGYGTPEHFAAIHAQGICPLHRQSYAPIKAQIASNPSSNRKKRSLS